LIADNGSTDKSIEIIKKTDARIVNVEEKGVMSFSHYWGVKFLTGLGNILYGTKLEDNHCGLRGFNREKINEINLECSGMEFASEIIIKCQKKI